MNVLFATAEMSPLAKVGGLGDVAGSLPRALLREGVDIRVVMPLYGAIKRDGLDLQQVAEVAVPWPDGPQAAVIRRATLRGVTVYLVENERFFGMPSVYGGEERERFLFFCDAVIAAAPGLGFAPEVIHAQDWHTALLLTRLAGNSAHPWASCGRVYTIHNLGMKAELKRDWAEQHGIGKAQLIPPDGLPREIAMSAMAQGIIHADRVNTVSDTYANEIMTAEYGAELDPLLRARRNVVSGIVNGIDYEEFNPATDPELAAHYDAGSLDPRLVNKRALQAEAGLPSADVPMFAAVTRLFAQKGMDLVAEAFEGLLAEHPAQLVILGTGEEAVHDALLALQAKHPARVKIWLDFNVPLGQRIYGGCDVFLMPSRYEPCGLGQLISLRYGAVPLVRRTGGLADTVVDADAAADTGTGFIFERADLQDLRRACERAIVAYAQRDRWRAIQRRGMREDWSWARAAGKYVDLYEAARQARAMDRGA